MTYSVEDITKMLEEANKPVERIQPQEVTDLFVEIAKLSGHPYHVAKNGIVIVDYKDW